MTLHLNSIKHLEREWNFAKLASFVPENDGYDIDRALGAHFDRFEREFEPIEEGDDE